MFRLGAQEWELSPGSECRDCQPLFGLRNRLSARLWLQQFASNPLTISAIRDLLTASLSPRDLSRVTDEVAVDYLADLLSRGVFHVHPGALRSASGGGAEEPNEVAIEEFVPRRPEPARRIAPAVMAEEEGLLPKNADEAAIAAVLKAASENGTPFCEECLKAALRRAVQDGVLA